MKTGLQGDTAGSRWPLVSMHRRDLLWAVALTLCLHAAILMAYGAMRWGGYAEPRPIKSIVTLQVLPPEAESPPEPERVPPPMVSPSGFEHSDSSLSPLKEVMTIREPVRATMAAPAPPTAQEWAFAASYTLKNSKGYRYSWGQQVRSMMGTAVEGPDQGVVRFRVQIAPSGQLQKLETLWSTSNVAERLARQAIEKLPPLPPTPTGEPLIFEKTISFTPFAREDPPIYKDDCEPDRPVFRNPFAWDGRSPHTRTAPDSTIQRDPSAMEECLKQLPQDSIEAESARDQRLLEQWGSQRLVN